MLRQTLASKKAVCAYVFLLTTYPLLSLASTTSAQELEDIKSLSNAIESGDFFEAENLVKRLPARLREKDAQVIVLEALVDKGFYRADVARSKIKKALGIDRNNGDALFEMALLLMEKRRWKRSEILLRAASVSSSLSESRRRSLSYYLGVIAFESGRIFESRNHFTRLNWMDTLDFAVRQSSTSYLRDIAGRRPWSVVAPLLFQYESNALGLDDSAELPEGYTSRGGAKILYGLFGNYSGVGGTHAGQGPWGYSLRVLASEALEQQFKNLNLVFSEAEVSWSNRSAGKNVINVSSSVNSVRVGGKSVTLSTQIKFGFNQNDFSAGFERDEARDSTIDRSAWILGVSRKFEVLQGDIVGVALPAELVQQIAVAKSLSGENKTELILSPVSSWNISKRATVSLSDQVSLKRISANDSSYTQFKNSLGVKSSVSVQPYLTLSAGYDFEISKRTDKESLTRKSTATLSVLGLF